VWREKLRILSEDISFKDRLSKVTGREDVWRIAQRITDRIRAVLQAVQDAEESALVKAKDVRGHEFVKLKPDHPDIPLTWGFIQDFDELQALQITIESRNRRNHRAASGLRGMHPSTSDDYPTAN